MTDKGIPADKGVGVERHDHRILVPSSNSKDHLEDTATPLVWNASCVSCSKSKRKCDGLRPCRSVVLTRGLTTIVVVIHTHKDSTHSRNTVNCFHKYIPVSRACSNFVALTLSMTGRSPLS